jgi:S-sulfosulfanyl-L-cysteine sulfohydrolase
VRWGASLLPGDDITREDIHNVTSMTYGQVYRTEMTGEMLHTILEDVADNLFNPDPYYQQGGDMVRVGGMGFAIDVSTKPHRQPHHRDGASENTGEAIDPARPTPSPAGQRQRRHRRPADLGRGRSHIRKLGTVRNWNPTPRSK